MGGSGVQVRASAVRVRDQYVLAKYGKLSREIYRRRASPELLSVFTTPGDVWVDFDLFLEATTLVCSEFGDGSPSLARAVGAFGAEANVGPWRAIIHRMLSPKIILEIAGMLWSHHYDGGRLLTSATGERSVSIAIEDFPRPHVMHCKSIEGWMEKTFQLSRPKHVTVQEVSCRTRGDPVCRFDGAWE